MPTLPLRALVLAAGLAAVAPAATVAAEPTPPPYGENITTAEAKAVLAKAEAEANRLGVKVGIAVADKDGVLVAFERMEGVNPNAAQRAPLKAAAAAIWRRPTETWTAPSPGAALVSRPNGGVVILRGGKVVGGLGVSSNPEHETEIARLAAGVLH
jgi:glc operon protein GlcG